MTDSYVNAKILEALEATNGDKHDAQKLLITWAIRDQQLLLGFAKPHLKELITSRIEEGLKKRTRVGKGGEESLFAGELDYLMTPQTKGEKRTYSKVPPPKSSLRQANVMQQIARAFKKK